MKKRWILRGMFIALLALCLGAWGVSYWRDCKITYFSDQIYSCSIETGRLSIQRFDIGVRFNHTLSWHSFPPSSSDGYDTSVHTIFHFLGFAVFRMPAGMSVTIPFWFLTLLATLLLWLVWRKTRPKLKGGAFPVVPAAKANLG